MFQKDGPKRRRRTRRDTDHYGQVSQTMGDWKTHRERCAERAIKRAERREARAFHPTSTYRVA